MPHRFAPLLAVALLLTDPLFAAAPLFAADSLLAADSPPPVAPAPAVAPPAAADWKPLFDGKTLTGWKESGFVGGGTPVVKEGTIRLPAGLDLTGITATAPIPEVNYEVSLEAMRVDGSDFFCTITFPVGKAPCSLIVGGWGGGVVGLSSLNGYDASENETTQYHPFQSGRWYPIRLRVTAQRITAWIDGEQIIDQDIRDRQLSIRIEVAESKPFGIASWQTTAALRNLKLRSLPATEVATINAELPDED